MDTPRRTASPSSRHCVRLGCHPAGHPTAHDRPANRARKSSEHSPGAATTAAAALACSAPPAPQSARPCRSLASPKPCACATSVTLLPCPVINKSQQTKQACHQFKSCTTTHSRGMWLRLFPCIHGSSSSIRVNGNTRCDGILNTLPLDFLGAVLWQLQLCVAP